MVLSSGQGRLDLSFDWTRGGRTTPGPDQYHPITTTRPITTTALCGALGNTISGTLQITVTSTFGSVAQSFCSTKGQGNSVCSRVHLDPPPRWRRIIAIEKTFTDKPCIVDDRRPFSREGDIAGIEDQRIHASQTCALCTYILMDESKQMVRVEPCFIKRGG